MDRNRVSLTAFAVAIATIVANIAVWIYDFIGFA